LSDVRLERTGNRLVLEVPSSSSLFAGETVQRRLDAVARSLGISSTLRQREAKELAPV
jgi:hypothetical protein